MTVHRKMGLAVIEQSLTRKAEQFLRSVNGISRLLCRCWREGALPLSAISAFVMFSTHAEAENLALHAKYSFTPAATYQYTQDPSDTDQLTDGKFAGGYFWTSREATVGWFLSGPISIEIDLGAASVIDHVCINTARGIKADVSFPERIDVFLSADQQRYKYVGDILNTQDHSDGEYLVKKFCGRTGGVGRYALIVLTPRGRYLVSDEIEVLGKSDRSLEPKPGMYPLERSGIPEFQSNLLKLRLRAESQTWMANKLHLATKEAARGNPEIEKFLVILQESATAALAAVDAASLEKNEGTLFDVHRNIVSKRFAAPIVLWHKDPWAIFNPLDTPSPESASNESARVDLARNGVATDAYVVTNSTREPFALDIITTLKNEETSAIRIRVREVIPVLLADSTVRGDPLIDLSQDKITVRPGESKQLWITVTADNAEPGEYSGEIRLTPITKKIPARSIAMNIRVWPFSLPASPNVHTVAWSYLNWRPIAAMPAEAVRDLVAHHTNTFVLHPSEVPWPKFKTPGGTAFTVNFDEFDRFVKLHKGEGKQLLFFMLFNDERVRSFGGVVPFMSPEWKKVFREWLQAWVSHAIHLGLTLDQFAFYPVDEPGTAAETAILIDTATLIKTFDPRLHVYTTIGDLANVDLLRAARVVDIFQVLVADLSGLRVDVLRGLGKTVWAYTAEGGGKAASPMAFYRMQAWKAFQKGLGGIGFWAYADTGNTGSGWDDLDDLRPDFSVIYEKEHMIVSSKRWEAWLEGVEDFELLVQAKKHIRSKAEESKLMELVAAAIANPDDYANFQSGRQWLFEVASR